MCPMVHHPDSPVQHLCCYLPETSRQHFDVLPLQQELEVNALLKL